MEKGLDCKQFWAWNDTVVGINGKNVHRFYFNQMCRTNANIDEAVGDAVELYNKLIRD